MRRRDFLRGAASITVGVALAKASIVNAQTYNGPPPNPNNTSLQFTSGGVIVVPPTIGNVTLTAGQQRTLSQLATDYFRSGMSRKQANITMSAVVRAFCQTMSQKGFFGVLTAAGVGGTYNLISGGNFTSGVINLGAGAQTVEFAPVECASTPYTAGSYPDSVTMGWYRNDRTCSTSTAYGFRISAVTTSAATDSGKPGGAHQWSWAYTKNLGVGPFGQQWKHFYTTQFGAYNPNANPIVVPFGNGLEVAKLVPSSALSQPISCELLDALKYALWKNAQQSGNWGNFRGFFMEPGSNGTWEAQDAGPPKDPPSFYTPACAAHVGSPVTLADFLEQPAAPGGVDPGNVEYPAEAKFPGEPGYTGGGTSPTPTPTPTPTPGPSPTPTDEPETGSCQQSTSWWEFWKPTCEPNMVEPDAAGELPGIEGITNPLTSMFDPIGSKLSGAGMRVAGASTSCPPIDLPEARFMGKIFSPARALTYHCDLVEPHRPLITGALGTIGTWLGLKSAMSA